MAKKTVDEFEALGKALEEQHGDVLKKLLGRAVCEVMEARSVSSAALSTGSAAVRGRTSETGIELGRWGRELHGLVD